MARRCRFTPERAQETGCFLAIEWSQLKRPIALTPARSLLKQLRASKAEEEDRRIGIGNLLDEIEERRFSPVEIFNDEKQRCWTSRGLEKAAGRKEDFLDRRIRASGSECRLEPQGDELRIRLACDEPANTWPAQTACELLHEFAQRPEGDALAVGEAAASHNSRRIAQAARELLREPAPTDAGVAMDRGQPARAGFDDIRERVSKPLKLCAPTHEWGVQA